MTRAGVTAGQVDDPVIDRFTGDRVDASPPVTAGRRDLGQRGDGSVAPALGRTRDSAAMVHLQRSVGNAAVSDLLSRQRQARLGSSTGAPTAAPPIQRLISRGSHTGWGPVFWVEGGKKVWEGEDDYPGLEPLFNTRVLPAETGLIARLEDAMAKHPEPRDHGTEARFINLAAAHLE